MIAQEFPTRPFWKSEVENLGFTFHSADDIPYWIDHRAFAFRREQVVRLAHATAEVYGLFLRATEHVIRNELFEHLSIPSWVVPAIKRSWNAGDPAIYGRFDFIWDGIDDPKVIEFNADTPTSLIESAAVQSGWLERHRADLPPGASQYNTLEKNLISGWKAYRALREPNRVHFTYMREWDEDHVTTEYMQKCASMAGLDVASIAIEDVGFDGGHFWDLKFERMDHIFKLYPWEMVWDDPFGPELLNHPGVTEPLWKIVTQSKGLLPIVYAMTPGHPNLLRSSFFPEKFGAGYVKKAKLSRQGANVKIVTGRGNEETGGQYDANGFIYQEYQRMPQTSDGHLIVGSWIANGTACGMSVRESDSLITEINSRFIPHFVLPD